MESLADRFIEERHRREAVGPGQRVPEEVRLLAVRYARWALESEGLSVAGAAERLSVRAVTLKRWLAAAEPVPAMRPVVVREDSAPQEDAEKADLTLVTPDGFRVEGLSGRELVDLVRALRA